MKKLIFILVTLALIAGGLGTIVYAAVPHVPMKGEKIVGQGRLGTKTGGSLTFWSDFRFTNPDCVGTITIARISIIRTGGTVVYEGPLLRQEVVGGEVVDDSEWMDPMKPHEGRHIILWTYMRYSYPPYDWMTKQDAYAQRLRGYSVEIFYKTQRRGLPLVGFAEMTKKSVLISGNVEVSGYRTPMFNLKQKLR